MAINLQQKPRGCGCKQHFGMFPVTEVLEQGILLGLLDLFGVVSATLIVVNIFEY